jgi:hypothetical protein
MFSVLIWPIKPNYRDPSTPAGREIGWTTHLIHPLWQTEKFLIPLASELQFHSRSDPLSVSIFYRLSYLTLTLCFTCIVHKLWKTAWRRNIPLSWPRFDEIPVLIICHPTAVELKNTNYFSSCYNKTRIFPLTYFSSHLLKRKIPPNVFYNRLD